MVEEIYYDPYDYALDAHPHPMWKRMRDEAPLYYNEKFDFFAVTRFNDVRDMSADWRTYSSHYGSVLELIDHPDPRLDILLENTGRVNFGPALPGEPVGLLNGVSLAGHPLAQWQNFSLPMLKPTALIFTNKPCTGPCFYRGTFTVDHPADTFLDTSALGKGEVWINGRPLGRFWHIGPQKALYLPAPWLHAGENDVIVFDLEGKPNQQLRGLDHPVLDAIEKTPRS